MSYEGIYYDLRTDTFIIDGDKIHNNQYMICRNDGTGYYAFEYSDRIHLKALWEKTKKGAMCDLSNEECKQLLELLQEMQRFNIKAGVEEKIVAFIQKVKPYAENSDSNTDEDSSNSSGYGYI
jgi:hypothetical protein